jgi:hypothetical protein
MPTSQNEAGRCGKTVRILFCSLARYAMQLIDEKRGVIMSKLAQIKDLEHGKGIQYLLDAAYKIFHNPIVIHDTNYNLKAYTDVVSDDPLWNELISTGTFSMKTQEFFAREWFTEDVANADKLVILKSSELKYDRISGYIFNRDNIKVAVITMVWVYNPFETEDVAAFEELADIISNEIHEDEYFTAYGRAYHEALIIKLIDHVIDNPIIYTPHVQIFLDGFDDYLHVAVVEIINKEYHQYILSYFKNLLESKYKSFKYAIYSDRIVMIISSKNKYFYEEQFFDHDDNPFKQNNMFVGISNSFENPYELREYYDQAVAALKDGMKKNSGQLVFLYRNMK